MHFQIRFFFSDLSKMPAFYVKFVNKQNYFYLSVNCLFSPGQELQMFMTTPPPPPPQNGFLFFHSPYLWALFIMFSLHMFKC